MHARQNEPNQRQELTALHLTRTVQKRKAEWEGTITATTTGAASPPIDIILFATSCYADQRNRFAAHSIWDMALEATAFRRGTPARGSLRLCRTVEPSTQSNGERVDLGTLTGLPCGRGRATIALAQLG